MTIDEAIRRLEKLNPVSDELYQDAVAISMGIKALEKGKPKKLVYDKDYWTKKPRCGICNKLIKYSYGMEFCPFCAHAIDWERKDEA